MAGRQWQWYALTDGQPRWRDVLREICLLGLLLVVLLPSARGHHPLLGWWPLWLVGMPLLAWWSAAGMPVLRRRTPCQARRRAIAPPRAVRWHTGRRGT